MLAVRAVDGNVYAQPLIVSGAKIVHRAGPTNTVIVATEHNSVYAFDADDINPASTSAELWHTGPKILGAHIETSKLYARIGSPTCEDLTTEIGITGTPAIQITKADTPKRGVIYVAAKSEGSAGYRYKLFTLDLATGRVISDVTIQGGVAGTGIGSIGEGKKSTIQFNALYELNRPALLLNRNTLFIAFGGHCDQGPYHGWLFAYDVSQPKRPKKLAIFCSTPNGKGSDEEGRAGIWMSGGIMSISANGDEAGSGILWVTMPYMTNANHAVVRGVLRALNASDVSKPELWDSESTGNENDRLGLFAKFCPPTVANGKVYVATFQEEIVGSDHIHKIMPSGDRAALVIYGLKQDDRAISSQRHMVFWRGNFQSISSKQRISPNW